MNYISVIAHGAPGSFVRRVQEDPTIAVELLGYVRAFVGSLDMDNYHQSVEAANELSRQQAGANALLDRIDKGDIHR